MSSSKYDRRRFLMGVGAAVTFSGTAAGQARQVSIVVDPADATASAAPPQWAVSELREALAARGVAVRSIERVDQAGAGDVCIAVAGAASPLAAGILRAAGAAIPDAPESLGLATANAGGRRVLLATGRDPRGLVYAVTELADRVRHAADPVAALRVDRPVVERPANVIRSVTRLFTSDVEDKPWYNDAEMWPRYLSMLATQRFNRFNLSLGIGYDFLRNVTDGYFLFAYPFLLPVPGYDVRVPQLPDAERDRNLKILQSIGEQTVARGMDFQLGIWMHGYEWINSPNPNYTIEGLNAQNHGPYCRDAVKTLLQACPAISGVTFRIHGESGVEEGSNGFWKTVFDGVAQCGRKVEIDMHAKGMTHEMLDIAVATGQPVKASPKFWGEHMGLPYHQAAIRELEMPRPGREGSALMRFSAGSRSFLRYGYGDLLAEDRRWGVLHRIWPGTQRLLVWGDPAMAAAQGRAFSFCGSDGVEIMEPLSFKGRRGSGIAGDRCGYLDASLRPRWDWEKYVYGMRLFGRLLYNPDSDPDVWRRYLANRFGAGAEATEQTLANCSRILPIVTTAHGASAGNNTYWPEVYTNQPIVDPERRHPYSDSPAPKVFGNVSPLDPQLFAGINEFAGELIEANRSGKYSPIEVATWIEDYAAAAAKSLAVAQARAAGADGPEFRRVAIDAAMQVGIGRFFAAKLRSGVLYAIYDRTGDRTALDEALKAYRSARAHFAEVANRGKDVYVPDITVGELPHLRGHWLDRLPAMDGDIADMAAKLETAKSDGPRQERARLAVEAALARPRRSAPPCRHTPAARFRPGDALAVELTVERGARVSAARLYFRHVNQAERYETADMEMRDGRYGAAIPGSYTQSPYPLEYYFELKQSPEQAWLYPGFAADLTNQPYFVVRRG